MRIARDEEDAVVEYRHAAIDVAALGLFVLVDPDLAARARIERVHLVAVGNIHDPVVNQRGSFQMAGLIHVINPLRDQRRDIRVGDLLQRTVALCAVIAGVR